MSGKTSGGFQSGLERMAFGDVDNDVRERVGSELEAEGVVVPLAVVVVVVGDAVALALEGALPVVVLESPVIFMFLASKDASKLSFDVSSSEISCGNLATNSS